MSKKDQLKRLDEVEGDESPLSMSDAANQIFGIRADENKFDRNVLKIRLEKIVPDPIQPRRAVPKKARGDWRGEADGVNDVLDAWHGLAEDALGESIDVISMIDKFNDGKELDGNIPHIALTYLELVGLAGSIKRDGLNSPITVTGRVAPHTIVTGERRFWAYCLLRQHFGDVWASIPASISGKANVWQQGAENAKRLNLTAIDLARSVALLVMDMYSGDDGVMFNDIGFFDHERDFYAQVADGVRYKIKDGYGQRVQDATGLKSKAQISQHRALLRLSREHWDIADADGWTENYARQFIPRDEGRLTPVNLDKPKKTPKEIFMDEMKPIIKHKIHMNKTGAGLYGAGGNGAMFVWWNQSRGGYETIEIITGNNAPPNTKVFYDAEKLLDVMYWHLSVFDAWEEMPKRAFDVIQSPSPLVSVAPAPSPAPQPFGEYPKFKITMMNWLESNVRESAQQTGFMGRGKEALFFVYWERGNYHYEKKAGTAGWMGHEKDMDKLIENMYTVQPELDKWMMMTLDQWKAMINPPKRATPEGDAKDKKFEAFKRAIQPKIAEWLPREAGYGIYAKSIYGQHIWVYMVRGKIQFLRDNTDGLLITGMDDLYSYMFRFMPDANTWKVISQSEYDKLIKKPASVDVKAVMHDMGIGDDDEYPDDDDDVDEETRELARQENAQIDADFAQYAASQPPLDAPRPHEKDTRYVGTGSLLHSFTGMLAGWMQVRNMPENKDLFQLRDFTPDDLAGMVKRLSPDEIAQVITVWGGIVGDALVEIQNQLIEMQPRIWADVPQPKGDD